MNYLTNETISILSQPFSIRAGQKQDGLIGNVLAFILPILGLIKIELIGELFVHEVILIMLFPILLMKRGNLLKQYMVKTILMLGVLWFGSQVLTDIIRDTPPIDYMRGWAKISLFLISFASLVMLLTTPLRVFLWISAAVVPMFFRPFQLFALDLDPLVLWKFGVGPSLLVAACLPSLWKVFNNPTDKSPVRSIAWLHIIFGVCSFFLNSRSFAGVCLVTGALLLLYIRYHGAKIKTAHLVTGIVCALLGVFVVISIYIVGAASGFFGEEAQYKYELQDSYGGGPLSVLLGGRSEGLVSTLAIADSPWIGHGSWAKDYRYVLMYFDMLKYYSTEQNDNLGDYENGLIPSHSYLFGAWVEAGLVGGMFWSWILLLCIFRVFPAAFETVSQIAICALLSLPIFIWNIFFSPFGANVRVDVAGILTIFSIVIAYHTRAHKQ